MRSPILCITLVGAVLMYAPVAAAAGAYATPRAANAADCIKLCNDDSLCVGWTFADSACGLWASLPKDAESAFTPGDHAPAFARSLRASEPQLVAAQQASRLAAPARRTQSSDMLLGGDDVGSELRPRLGGGS
jgi:hypothetical protein